MGSACWARASPGWGERGSVSVSSGVVTNTFCFLHDVRRQGTPRRWSACEQREDGVSEYASSLLSLFPGSGDKP